MSFANENRAAREYASSALGIMSSTTITNPLDVAKVRLQMQAAAQLGGGECSRSGLSLSTIFSMICREEGPSALLRGTGPAVARAATYGGLRLGMYAPIKRQLARQYHFREPEQLPVFQKVIAGMVSGVFAQGLTHPTELLKVRRQVHPGHGYARQGVIDIVRTMLAEQGIRSLWAGVGPAMTRAALLTSSQCVCYEEIKNICVDRLRLERSSFSTHLSAAMVTGLVTTTITNPLDVVKSYMMIKRHGTVLQCVRQMLREEGLRVLVKGWSASYLRLGPLTVGIFVFTEHFRGVLGLDSI
eukprot:m.25482 g.25482  ORF g.25482 m.25482 type:complete len:300 (+) comp13185_c0_seq1:126-1025(+)